MATPPASPAISVCIPTYNGERYLPQCIESVLEQSFGEFELLIVDDASSDGTVQVARAYAVRDARVRVVENDRNRGLAANWNRCVELSRGEWVKFVFQDDLIAPRCLERMLDHARGSVSFIAGRREFRFEDGIGEETREWYPRHARMIKSLPYDKNLLSAEACGRLALDRFGDNLFGEPTAVMLKRDVFSRFGLFNPELIMLCDLEYWTRVTIHTGAVHVPENLSTFRVHAGATSATNNSRRHFRTNVLDMLIILHDYLHDPAYEPLWRGPQGRARRAQFEKRFARMRHEARARASWAARGEPDRDRTPLDEWRHVVARYPKIDVGAGDHLLWRARTRLRRALQARSM